MDGQGSQLYASKNVAAFLFGLISELNISSIRKVASTSEYLFEIVCKLYPRRVEDKRIWERAGGDLSLISLNTPGKGQGFDAVNLLKLGGGGSEITWERLVHAMKEDFGQNEDLKNMTSGS